MSRVILPRHGQPELNNIDRLPKGVHTHWSIPPKDMSWEHQKHPGYGASPPIGK